jgi:hypothetical protein
MHCNQCLGSWMSIPIPASGCFPMPDPGCRITDSTKIKNRREKKLVSLAFFCSHKYHKLIIILFLNRYGQKKFEQLTKDLSIFYPRFFSKLSETWVVDPISGKYLYWILDPDPGVTKAPDPGSGSITFRCTSHS